MLTRTLKTVLQKVDLEKSHRAPLSLYFQDLPQSEATWVPRSGRTGYAELCRAVGLCKPQIFHRKGLWGSLRS